MNYRGDGRSESLGGLGGNQILIRPISVIVPTSDLKAPIEQNIIRTQVAQTSSSKKADILLMYGKGQRNGFLPSK